MAILFSKILLDWDANFNQRSMPWKGETNPYRIWLSEIILQQTRVEQGWAYYLRFIEKYPEVKCLAEAPESEVMKLWEGLGYYSRCRNLIASARMIMEAFGGEFPSSYHEILSLKGVGTYTAAAISSFAFGLPYAVVDGNVQRVLARVYGIETPIDSTDGKKKFEKLAQNLLDQSLPAKYNQAIMDFGATVCKPQSPVCHECPFSPHCIALNKGKIEQLPIKSKKLAVRERWFNYYILQLGQGVYIRTRYGKDIWQDLNEFVLHETQSPYSNKEEIHFLNEFLGDIEFEMIKIVHPKPHKLSHQCIHSRIYAVRISQKLDDSKGYKWISLAELSKHAFPRLLNEYSNLHFFQ